MEVRQEDKIFLNFDRDTETNIRIGDDSERSQDSMITLSSYFIIGIFFGIVLIKTEVISWYRIQEMFRLQSFHMYGVIGSALMVGLLSVWLIKKFNIKTITGEKIDLPRKRYHKGNVYGGLIFGLGWALTGACPGPIYALIGSGFTVFIVTLLSALAGTWMYAMLQDKLPH